MTPKLSGYEVYYFGDDFYCAVNILFSDKSRSQIKQIDRPIASPIDPYTETDEGLCDTWEG